MSAAGGDRASFEGFPPEALTFYEGLEADNSKTYWTANRAVYEEAVRGPMEALTGVLEPEFGPFKIFRPHRDVRFSKDKSPYKTHIGAVTEGEGGEFFYVQLSATGLYAASGYYHMASDQLERYRVALDDDAAGEEALAVVASLEQRGYEIGAHGELKTAPRGYRRDHPRIRLLRLKGLMAGRSFPPDAWFATAEAQERIAECWRGCRPLAAWLNAHVGPSSEAPPEDAW